MEVIWGLAKVSERRSRRQSGRKLNMGEWVILPGGGGRSGSGGVGGPLDRTCGLKNSLEWPKGRIFLTSLGSECAFLRTRWYRMGPRQRLGTISRFWGR